MILRPYQEDAVKKIMQSETNDCIVLPCGAGKSIVISEICRQYQDKSILILAPRRELIEQNSSKLYDVEHGVYCAGLGRKELKPITVASIQSIRKAENFDLIIVDECDLINHKDEGLYRKLISSLPNARAIGLTATPYRVGHGLITDKPAIFDTLIYPEKSDIISLIGDGFLSPLTSKATPTKLNVAGVKKRGGEYIESELQKAVNKKSLNSEIVAQTIERAGDRKHWIFFCAGIEHAEAMAQELNDNRIPAASLSSRNTKQERLDIIARFKSGGIQALTNNDILTVGFDFPNIDLIVFARPTMSPRLYVQMAGRGMRLKSHINNCLCLDFAGVVALHGAITDVKPPKKKGEDPGIPPSKECPKCFEIIPAQVKTCPDCGYVFPVKEKEDIYLRSDCIMGTNEPIEMIVDSIKQKEHISRKSGKRMIKVSYYPTLGVPIDEYLSLWDNGVAGILSRRTYQNLKNTKSITYIKNGKYFKIISRKYD